MTIRSLVLVAAALLYCGGASAAASSVCRDVADERSTTTQAQILPTHAGSFFTDVRAYAQREGYRYSDSGAASLQEAKRWWLLYLDKAAFDERIVLHIDNAAGSSTYTLTVGWCEGNTTWGQHMERFLKFAEDLPSARNGR